MTFLADLLNAVFDLLTRPFGDSAAWAMIVLAGLAGPLLLVLFKVSSNQERLAAAKRQLMGHIYEMGLYQDSLRVLLRIQVQLARANLRYLAATAPSLLVLVPVIVLVLAQFECRFAHRPFHPGETALLTATTAAGREDVLNDLSLVADDGVEVQTLPVRDREARNATWRIRVRENGRHELTVALPGGHGWTKRLEAGRGLTRLAGTREKAGWHHLLLNPAEKPLEPDSPLASISLQIPPRHTRYAGLALNWLVAFCVFSLAVGLALKDLFRVKI